MCCSPSHRTQTPGQPVQTLTLFRQASGRVTSCVLIFVTRVTRNADLWERVGQEPVAKQILRRKWGWIGHTLRKPAPSTTPQALTWNPQVKRKRGRPRNSWRQDTEAELKQQATNWSGMTTAAQNRVRWRVVVDGVCSTGERWA